MWGKRIHFYSKNVQSKYFHYHTLSKINLGCYLTCCKNINNFIKLSEWYYSQYHMLITWNFIKECMYMFSFSTALRFLCWSTFSSQEWRPTSHIYSPKKGIILLDLSCFSSEYVPVWPQLQCCDLFSAPPLFLFHPRKVYSQSCSFYSQSECLSHNTNITAQMSLFCQLHPILSRKLNMLALSFYFCQDNFIWIFHICLYSGLSPSWVLCAWLPGKKGWVFSSAWWCWLHWWSSGWNETKMCIEQCPCKCQSKAIWTLSQRSFYLLSQIQTPPLRRRNKDILST